MNVRLLISLSTFVSSLGCLRGAPAEIPCSSNTECLSQECFHGFCTDPSDSDSVITSAGLPCEFSRLMCW